ncbi:monovalent cation/H+ antiporter complex subunit F [Streptomyces coffeae]|uniref:MrpF/PhaF family protein n=1 Tax=Streptomyces coffeae TaxID=621382 RepID=A0ABS1NGT3_9ACTN|nr:monovalent cation/H+ antiporter complex subunit F [Streptomyces coffeae]MBL1099289.1 MrpF/PhaF family protein [Streptomyces coffeae]
MNGWIAAGAALLACGVAPAAGCAATGPVRRRVPAQNLTSTFLSLVFLLLAQGFHRTAYTDTALVLSVLGPAGTLLYVRLLADELADRPPRPRVLRTVTTLSYLAVPAVLLPLCFITGPGRAMGKLLVIGALLVCGSWSAARAVTAAATAGHTIGAPVEGTDDG